MNYYSMMLRDCLSVNNMTEKDLFNFEYYLSDRYKSYFEEMFIMRYFFSNISYDSFQMFLYKFEYKIKLLSRKYEKFYSTEDIIINPFINFEIQKVFKEEQKQRNKNIDIKNSKNNSTSYNNNIRNDLTRFEKLRHKKDGSLLRHDSNTSSKSLNDINDLHNNLFSDTPQNLLTNKELFNNGYITKLDRNIKNINEKSSNKTINYSEDNNLSAEKEDEINNNVNNVVTQDKNASNLVTYSDILSQQALIKTLNNDEKINGLSKVLVSDALIKYRESIINITENFLNELEDLFIMVY